MIPQFKDKVVVVLGASAEGGTGWRCAERFAAEGARLIVAARSLAGVQKLAAKIGGRALRCDVSRESDVAAVAAAATEWGGLDAAVNAAGHAVPSAVDSFDQTTLQSAIEVNFYGNLYFFRQMAGAMKHGGSITTIASVAATMVTPGNVLYGCAKAATVTAVRYAALEYAPRNIRVNALLPGLIDTPLAAPLVGNKALLAVFLKEVPLKRVSEAVEIANAALWLASSPSITGSTITIDGGISLRRAPQLDELPQEAYTAMKS